MPDLEFTRMSEQITSVKTWFASSPTEGGRVFTAKKRNESAFLSASNRIAKTETNYEKQFMIFLLEEIIIRTLIISTNSIIQRN